MLLCLDKLNSGRPTKRSVIQFNENWVAGIAMRVTKNPSGPVEHCSKFLRIAGFFKYTYQTCVLEIISKLVFELVLVKNGVALFSPKLSGDALSFVRSGNLSLADGLMDQTLWSYCAVDFPTTSGIEKALETLPGV